MGAALVATLESDQITSVYQPIVELDSGAVVAYEALARGPRDTELEFPAGLIATARHQRLLPELDMACREAAFRGARDANLHSMWTLLVNTEPDTSASAFGASASKVAAGAGAGAGDMNVIVELTERALVDNPVELLHLVKRIRAHGWGIALDDVGANRASLALLPILRPDVIKLDMRLIQERTTAEVVEIVGAVNAESERSGGVIVAEGIETVEHLAAARALGATHGQGFLFGRAGPLPPRLPPFTGARIAITDRSTQRSAGTPFELGAAVRTTRTGSKALLLEFSKHLEQQAMNAGRSGVLIATFQEASLFTPATQARYAELVERLAFVGVLGEAVGLEPLPGIRGGLLAANDPLVDEWDIVVISSHYAATLVARDLGADHPDGERRFTFVFSHDRELAIQVATYLVSRISPTSTGTGT